MANVIEIKITAQNAQAIAALKQVAEAATQSASQVKAAGSASGNGFKQLGDEAERAGQKIRAAGSGDHFAGAKSSGEGFLGTLSKIGMAAFGIIETLKGVKEVATTVFGTGLKFDQQMETGRLGIAGILMSMTKLNSKELELNQALGIANQTMKQIQQNAVKIGLPAQDMLTAFQSVVGPALTAKMTLEEIVKLTATGTKAVKTMLGPQGNDVQIAQELRSMVSGNIDQNSQVARAMGITNAEVERAKTQAGGLFAYLMEKLSGFTALAEEWPKTMTGSIEKFKAMFQQSSGSAFETIFNSLKTKINELTDKIFVVDEKTKEVSFNPELLSTLTSLANGMTALVSGTVEFGTNLAKVVSGPASALVSILGVIFNNVQQVYLTILAWFAIDKLRPIIADLSLKLQYQLSVFRMLVATSGVFNATLTATGVVIKSLLVTTGWGILAVAIGYAADQAFKLWENLDKAGKARDNYFKTKEKTEHDTNMSNLTDRFNKPVYSVNPDANLSGMDKTSFDKLEKFIAAVQYMAKIDETFKPGDVTITSGKREWGGHVSGSKADISMPGMFDPATRARIIDIAKQMGIAILDEVEVPASASAKAKAEWGPHLDLDMAGSGSAGKNLTLKNLPQDTEELAKAKVALADAIAKGKLDEYIAELKRQEQALDNRYSKTTAGTATDDEKLAANTYNQLKRQIATARTNAETATLQYQVEQKQGLFGNKNLSDADKTNLTKDIETLQSQIRQKQIDLQTTLDALDNTNVQALQALKDAATDIKVTNLENKGKYGDAQKLRSQKSNRALVLQLEANGMTETARQLQDNINTEQITADLKQAQKDLEAANAEMVKTEGGLLSAVENGTKTETEAINEYAAAYAEKTKAVVEKLRALLDAAVKSGNTDLATNIRTELNKIPDVLKNFVNKLIQQTQQILQAQIDLINANTNLTGLEKSYKTKELERQIHQANAEAYEAQAATLRTKEGAAAWSAQTENQGKDVNLEIKRLEAQAQLEKLKGTYVSLMQEVENAGRQGLENGLVQFFESGYQSCHKLIDAVRDLAIAILTEMNKVFSNDLARRLMGSLWPTSSRSGGSTGKSGAWRGGSLEKYATGGVMDSGAVKGPGNGTSDSILAYLGNFKKFVGISNGEYVIRSAAVKKFGTGFFDSLNSGLIPSGFAKVKARFADGGVFTGKKIGGAQDLATSLVNNNSTSIPLKIVNVTDPNEIGRYLSSRPGEKVMVNWIKNNASVVRHLLSIRG